MGAMTLLVDRRGASLSVSNNTKAICVRYPDGEVHRIGAFALARIIIHGNAQLSAAVLRVDREFHSKKLQGLHVSRDNRSL